MKSMKKTGGLRRRWLLNTVGVVFALGLVCVMAVTASYATYYYSNMQSDMENRAKTTTDFFADYINQDYGDYYQSCITYAKTFEDKGKIELQFINNQGSLVASSYGPWAGPSPSTSDIWDAISIRDKSSYIGRDPDTGERIMAVSCPMIYSNGEVIGVLRYVTSTRLVNRQIILVCLVCCFVLTVVLAVVLLSSGYCIRSILNPVAEITEKAQRIASGSYGVQIQTPFKDEIGDLADTINEMSTKIAQNEKMQAEFVSQLSHELRTPLTNIRSYAETIRDAGDELPRELENSFLDIVINESDRMTHIVQDLLTLSRLDSGRSEMNMARFDFGAAIDSVLRSIELEARRHGHELTHDYHDLPMIMGDRGRIEQVMLNVLGNAVKYTPDGGHIRVTAGTVGERVWMEVADDGIGIPKADRSRIFERFYRVDKARSRESGGTGLGLSIATEIVQRHNGTLSLVDREGPGTTVRLELPIRQSEVGGAQEGGNG